MPSSKPPPRNEPMTRVPATWLRRLFDNDTDFEVWKYGVLHPDVPLDFTFVGDLSPDGKFALIPTRIYRKLQREGAR